MAIKFYDYGEHGSGFVGYRVSVALRGNYRTEYFSTAPAKIQDESDSYVRYQHLKAQMLSVQLEAEVALDEYKIFVSEDDPKADIHQGVGCHGIICQFSRSKNGVWQAGFLVRRSSGIGTLFSFSESPFSRTWRDALVFWQSLHGVYEDDVKRLLETPPEPSKFKALRRYMNETLKSDIPIETLNLIFEEQRKKFAQRKALEKESQMILSKGLKASELKEIEVEMMSWFESENSR